MRRALAALALAGLAIAGCGGSPRPAPTVTVTASPVSTPLPSMNETQECAALDMVRMGYDTYANQVRTVAGQYTVSQATAKRMIAKAIKDHCPGEVSVIPAGSPLP